MIDAIEGEYVRGNIGSIEAQGGANGLKRPSDKNCIFGGRTLLPIHSNPRFLRMKASMLEVLMSGWDKEVSLVQQRLIL
jgi:hypothetical protein